MLSLTFDLSLLFPVGGLAKSNNYSQMNLSGSSSSLTSDASTKAVSLRSYGIGELPVLQTSLQSSTISRRGRSKGRKF